MVRNPQQLPAPRYWAAEELEALESFTAPVINGADVENASSGQVPTAQGDGTLAMEDASGGSGIFEDTDGDSVYEQTTGDGIDVPSLSGADIANATSGYALVSDGDGTLSFQQIDQSVWEDADGDNIYTLKNGNGISVPVLVGADVANATSGHSLVSDGDGTLSFQKIDSSVWEDADGDNIYTLKNGDGISVPVLMGADVANAASGQVPVAQGDGTLAMQDQSGGSGIFEDSDGDNVYEQTTGDGIDVPSLSGADIANAYSGTVPTAQGDGTLAMESVSGGSANEMDWKLDGSSSGTLTNQIQHTLNGTWDYVRAVGWVNKRSSGSESYICRVNSDNGDNYNMFNANGTQTLSASGFKDWAHLTGGYTPIDGLFTGRWDETEGGYCGARNLTPLGQNIGSSFVVGQNTLIDGPLQSITVRAESGSTYGEFYLEVYGLNITDGAGF